METRWLEECKGEVLVDQDTMRQNVSLLSPPLLFPLQPFVGEQHWSGFDLWRLASPLPKPIGHQRYRRHPDSSETEGCTT